MTTTSNQTTDMFEDMDNQSLLNRWNDTEHWEAHFRLLRQHIEFELITRMKADEATVIFHETLTCELKQPSPAYDLGKLNRLRELLPDEVIQTAFTPAHLEMVPDKWDARVFKGWGKYGTEIAQVIETATIPGTPRLIIKSKELPPRE